MKKTIIFVLAAMMLFSFCACQNQEPTDTDAAIEPEPTQITYNSDNAEIKAALDMGLMENISAQTLTDTATVGDAAQMLLNAMKLRYGAEESEYLTYALQETGTDASLTRAKLAIIIFHTAMEFVNKTNFPPSTEPPELYGLGAGLIAQKKEWDAPNNIGIWDCSDIDEIDAVTDYNAFPLDYCIQLYAIDTGDKIFELTEDLKFLPNEEVSYENALMAVSRFLRSIEDEPEYKAFSDADTSTIDKELLLKETSLPYASNSDLPNWRGFNVSNESILTRGALCGNPDGKLREADIKYLSSLGANFLHIYLSWSWFQGPAFSEGMINETRLQELDRIIQWSMGNDVHIQLVFNDVPNLESDLIDMDTWREESDKVFTDESVRDSVAECWSMLARRYADIPNNYLSFNLMNECNPLDDENYAWAFEPSLNAIWEVSPDRVVVADIHSSNITGESMAALGCALSYHLYEPRDITMIQKEVEEANPGFYENAVWPLNLATSVIWGPDGPFEELRKKPIVISGEIGGADLHVKINRIADNQCKLKITSNGEVLYEGVPEYNYQEDIDWYEIPDEVVVSLPEGAETAEISCYAGYNYDIGYISLEYPDGTLSKINTFFDDYNGIDISALNVDENKSITSQLNVDANFIMQNTYTGKVNLFGLKDISEKYGVDMMIGECGVFEASDPMSAGITIETFEALLLDETTAFGELGLGWAYESLGKYCVLTSYPRFDDVEYYKLEGSPYYVNTEIERYFKEIFAH